MFLRTVELAFARFQARGDAAALAVVFDRTAPELLRVARHLAHTTADAEDLLQSTFLLAIESAKEHERGRPVLPWLLGILANQARSSRRSLRRVVDPTRLRREVVADVASDVAARELNEALNAAITAMPESYRPVLRLWFEHGLDAQEIAATLERPAGTVRAQIARGLDQLRRALPQGLVGGVAGAALAGRGLAAVRSSVLAACPGTAVTAVSALALGGLLVLHHKLLAAGTALVLGLLAWSVFGGEPPPEPAGAGTATAAKDAASATLDRPADAPEAPRRDASGASAEREPKPAQPSEADAATGELVVRLVSARDGAPLPGIGVAVQRLDDLPGFSKLSAYVPSDAAGVVRFEKLRPATWLVDLDRIGSLAAGDVKTGTVTERVIEVPDGITVQGTVVDAGGRPVSGATIAVHGSRLCAPTVATTDALGRFTASHLLEKVELQARKAGLQPSLAHRVAGAPGATVAMTLQIGAAGRRLHGRALDAQGHAIARAAVAVLPESARALSPWDKGEPQPRSLWLQTDADGRFLTDECGIGRFLVLVQPLGDETTPCWAFADTQQGDAVVELRAALPIAVEGRIETDTPGDAITVTAFPRSVGEIGFLLNLMGARSAQTAPDGTFRLSGLIAGEIELTARRGFETVAQEVLTLQPGQTARWVPVAAASRPLRIRVTSTAPLPPQLVLLIGPHVPDNSAPSLVPIVDGEATFTGTRPGDVDVTAVMMYDGAQLVMLARLSAVPAGTAEVELVLKPEDLPVRHVRGRLVDAMGAPIGNATVAAMRVDQQGLFARRSMATAADGTFAIGPLPAGSWVIQLGELASAGAIGHAILSADRDADLGDLKGGSK